MLSAGSFFTLLLAMALGVGATPHGHHKHLHASGRRLTDVEEHVRSKVQKYVDEETHKLGFRMGPLAYHYDTPHCRGDGTGQACCLADTVVDLKDIGVEKNLSPETFVAWKCAGDCPRRNPLMGEDAGEETYCRPASYTSLLIEWKESEDVTSYGMVPDALIWSCVCK